MDGPGAYATAKGLQPIGSIEPGTLVKSFDFACGKWVSGEVTKRHDNVFSGRIVRVQIGATAIEATAGHPFWVLAGEELEKRAVPPELHQSTDEGHALVGRWVSAVDLRPGDVVTGLDGDHRQISKVTVREDQAIAVSNLSIRGCRNYAVGPLAILVHNGDAFCDVYREALTRIGQAKKAVASSALVAASKAEGVAIHAHHIVLKTVSLSDWWKGRAPYIKRAQAVLEAVDIPLLDKLDDFATKVKNVDDLANMTWALNRDHTTDYVRSVAEALEDALSSRTTYAEQRTAVLARLQEIAAELSKGGKFRFVKP